MCIYMGVIKFGPFICQILKIGPFIYFLFKNGDVSSGPFPAILGKGPWLELGENMRHFGNIFRNVDC